MSYSEQEIKVLDINKEEVISLLEKMGAKKVFDGPRTRTTFDFEDNTITSKGDEVRLTEEDKLKLSYESKNGKGEITSTKVFVSRKQETVDFLHKIGLEVISESKSHRVSFELGDIDFDIDEFEGIPAFLEIDLGNSNKALSEILKLLQLENNEIVKLSTRELYKRYSK